ncbi:MAG: hypothetical protein JO233_00045 [Candidatus Eremiobacteraeota bacterium]|nr:hypothetical protein [Candidatus Eremiobacteraeota bacterium]
MECVVAGIARTSEPKQLEEILMGCAHLDAKRLAVITKSKQTNAYDQSPLNFVHSSSSWGMPGGTGGTGVPGMGSRRTFSDLVRHEAAPHYLEDIAIPRDLAENYNVAIHEGRSVVTFKATTDEAKGVEDTFRGCGLVNVRTLTPRSEQKAPT